MLPELTSADWLTRGARAFVHYVPCAIRILNIERYYCVVNLHDCNPNRVSERDIICMEMSQGWRYFLAFRSLATTTLARSKQISQRMKGDQAFPSYVHVHMVRGNCHRVRDFLLITSERGTGVTVCPIKIAFHNNGWRRWDLDSPQNTVLNASSHSLSKVAIVAAGRLIPHTQDPTTSITQADLLLNSILLLLPRYDQKIRSLSQYLLVVFIVSSVSRSVH